MTTVSVPVPTADKAAVILQIFQSATHPLTLAQAKKLYQGSKQEKNEMAQIVEGELLMRGQLFRCSPAGKTPRYWDHDEEEKVRETIDLLLGREALSERNLTTAVNQARQGGLPRNPAAPRTRSGTSPPT